MAYLYKSDVISESPDDVLVTQAVEGSHEAFEKLIGRHQGWIYNIALRMVGEPPDAEDITQEVLLKIIKNLPGFKGKSGFRTWAYRIVVNYVLNMKRRAPEKKWTGFGHYSKSIDNTPDMDFPDQKSLPVEKSLIIEEIKVHCLMGLLLCLNRKHRLAFILGEMFQFSDAVSSEILGSSKDNFRQMLSRARRKLYDFLAAKCGFIHSKNSCHCERKAKAMMDKGVVDPQNLYFTKNCLFRINSLIEEKYSRFNDLCDTRFRQLIKEQPFLESPDFVKSFRRMLDTSEFKDIFNL